MKIEEEITEDVTFQERILVTENVGNVPVTYLIGTVTYTFPKYLIVVAETYLSQMKADDKTKARIQDIASRVSNRAFVGFVIWYTDQIGDQLLMMTKKYLINMVTVEFNDSSLTKYQ